MFAAQHYVSRREISALYTTCILNSLNVNRDKTEKLMKTKTHFSGGFVNVSISWVVSGWWERNFQHHFNIITEAGFLVNDAAWLLVLECKFQWKVTCGIFTFGKKHRKRLSLECNPAYADY